MKKTVVEGVDYYLENGRVVFTEIYHKSRGYCCGNGCRHCPYFPKHEKGGRNVTENEKDRRNEGISYI